VTLVIAKLGLDPSCFVLIKALQEWFNWKVSVRGIALIDIVDQLKDGIALAHLVEIVFSLDIMEVCILY